MKIEHLFSVSYVFYQILDIIISTSRITLGTFEPLSNAYASMKPTRILVSG